MTYTSFFRVYPSPSRVAPFRVTVTAYVHKLNMELDTGSAVSVISEDTIKSLFKSSSNPLLFLNVHIQDTH